MNEKIVISQAELDAVPVDYNGRIIIKFGTPSRRAHVSKKYLYSVEALDNSFVEAWGNSSVEARDNSSVVAWENSSVVARDNSSVVAWGNSSVVARGNSSVVARGNSSVVAWENSSVVAWDNSSVEARDNSSVKAWENSSVEARDNSSVEALENSQIVDANRQGNIKASGNARIVHNPDNITDWAAANDIAITDGKIRLYKAIHKRGGKYIADWDNSFVYTVGEIAVADSFTTNPVEDCGHGIHMATLAWSAMYGYAWDDIALLELEADADEIVVPLYETGKVRAPKARVIREVPLEEAGIMGKILAKRRAK